MLAPPGANERGDRALAEIDGIEVDKTVDQPSPHALLKSLRYRGITPQRRHLHAVIAAGPLIRAHRIRGAHFKPVAVKVGRERDPGRAPGLVLSELLWRELARKNLGSGAAYYRLRQQRQRGEGVRVEALGSESVLA